MSHGLWVAQAVQRRLGDGRETGTDQGQRAKARKARPTTGTRRSNGGSHPHSCLKTHFFGTVTSFGYGARGSLTSITYPSATGSSITYAYDQALNMTNENTTAPGQPTGTGYETWAYNADELRSAEYLNGSSTPSYSWNYNSRLMVTSNATTSFSYHNNGAIISSSSSQASTTFASSDVPNYNGTELCWSINALVSAPSCGTQAPSGATYYFYTSDGQISNVLPTSSSQASASASYAWDPLGHMCWSAPSYVSSPTCSSPPSGATSYTPGTHLQEHSPTQNAPGDAAAGDDQRSDETRPASMTARRAIRGRPWLASNDSRMNRT